MELKEEKSTIFNAIQSGLLESVQAVSAAEGPSVFSLQDDKGYTPAHWACYRGHEEIVRYILDNNGPIDKPSNNELGAHPIHWACVNGHIAIVDILLQAGVSVNVVDNKGCTPIIMAAQYGHTVLVSFLMGKGAKPQMVDEDGNSVLHWAVFYGHMELMRYLIHCGLNPKEINKYGQSTLHLACINSNFQAVRELHVKHELDINKEDKDGKTPLTLASANNNTDMVDYLQKQIKKKKFFSKIDLISLAFNTLGSGRKPVLFFMINFLCWGYPMYVGLCLPYTWSDFPMLHVVFLLFNVVLWICLFHASTTDPGYLPRNVPEYDMAIKQLVICSDKTVGQNLLCTLCHTCRLVKPLRSKHCRVCNRCVKVFDHHCPYIYNCVGYKNRGSFALFTTSVSIVLAISLKLSIHTVNNYLEWNWLYKFYVLLMGFYAFSAFGLFVIAIYNAAINVTTNEGLAFKKYAYMQDKFGRVKRPFDQGVVNNLLDFFHLRNLIEEDSLDQITVT
ncbi:uncharacterized protein LOC127715279 [Mytilus californianus]|uniref:uncharacterized protein LOC127715279 n=1 Tax=Mytilus californianus TaxID=6549 RepID=UPI002245D5E0|nr:uncharacterized protein LOC127715279 [Mytilus californianus]